MATACNELVTVGQPVRERAPGGYPAAAGVGRMRWSVTDMYWVGDDPLCSSAGPGEEIRRLPGYHGSC